MNHSNLAIPTLSLSVNLIAKHPIRQLSAPIRRRNFANPRILFPVRLNETPVYLAAKRVLRVRATADGDGKTGNWVNRLPIPGLGAENVFRLISSATGSPIGQFISSPVTFLHSVDPRIKLVWLLTLVILPARANIVVRLGLVLCTALLSISVLPRQVWMDQLARVSLLSGILFITLGLGSDGAPPMLQSRTPPSSITSLPDLPMSLSGYSYMLLKLGPLQFTRKGLSVGSTAACLTFIIFQSASICLATTTPEQLALALRWFLFPLTYIGVPVCEIILTLLLSLRFINLVFDEVRSVALGIVSRRVNWKQLTVLETLDIFASFIRRIFKNIFRHAEQISQAMIVRGFRGESSSHKIYFFSGSSNKLADFASILCLIGVISTALLSEYIFV
uniref:Protein ABCI12, chloroplastic n=1 Tax=Noccaea caerulescens TaxID=107243 RepID=A0A1J3KAX3_NOCCA